MDATKVLTKINDPRIPALVPDFTAYISPPIIHNNSPHLKSPPAIHKINPLVLLNALKCGLEINHEATENNNNVASFKVTIN